jgi:hypothetical protein
MGIVGAVFFVMVYWGFKKFGLFSYNAIPPEHIQAVYAEFQKRYPVLSKVAGNNPLLGGYFERGVAGGTQGGPLYYFHYTNDGKGGVNFQLYPEFLETWTTDSGLFGLGKYFTGSAVNT